MVNSQLTRRSFAKQLMFGTAALGSRHMPAIGAQTPVTVGVPTVDLPVPAPVAEDLVVLRVYNRTFTSTPAWVLDLQNRTDGTWAAPGVTMAFLDAGGNAVGENHPFQLLETMPPGELVPYAAEFHDFHPADAEWSSVRFSLRGRWPATPLYADDLLEIRDTVEESDGSAWRVAGTITNVSGVVVESVGITAIIRSHAGEFLGSIWTTVTTPIPPSGSEPFVCDTGDPSGVMYDPFEVTDDPSAFIVQLVPTPMATAWLE